MKIHAFALGLASLLASAVSFYVPAPTPSDVVASPTPVSYQICNERKVCDNICTNLPSDDPCKKRMACTLAEYAPECAGQNVATGTGDAFSDVPTGDGQNEDVWNEDVWNEEQEQEHGQEQEQEDPSVLISSSRDYEEEEASPVSPEQEQDQEEQTARDYDCDPWPDCVEQQEQEEQTDNEEEQEHQPEEDQEQGESTSSSETTSSDESTSPSGSKSSSESSTATVAWAVPVAIGGVLVSGGGAFLLARKHKTAATQRPEMGALDSQA